MSDFDYDGVPDLVGTLWDPSSGSISLHILSGASNYQSSILDTNTPYYSSAQNGSDSMFFLIDYDQDGIPDLVAVKLFNTSGMVEVHVLSGASNYQQWIAHIATSRASSPANSGWSYLFMDLNQDGIPGLVGTFWVPSSQQIEVHVLSGAGNFQQSLADVTTPMTSFAQNAADFTFASADLDGDGIPDLVGIKIFNTQTVEMPALSGASNFQQWLMHSTSGFGSTDVPPNFQFNLAVPAISVQTMQSLEGPDNPDPNPPPSPSLIPAPVVTASAVDCNDITGIWNDNSANYFYFSQAGNTVTGSSYQPDQSCGSVTWSITGYATGSNTFSLTESSPNPQVDRCGRTAVSQEPANVTINSCSSGTEQYTGSSSGRRFSPSYSPGIQVTHGTGIQSLFPTY